MVLEVEPELLLGIRDFHHPQGITREVLIKWQGLPDFDATWEAATTISDRFPHFHLEDKMVLWEGGIVTHQPTRPKPPIIHTYSRKPKKEQKELVNSSKTRVRLAGK